MKISTKGRYGLRAMVDLAAFSHGDHVALSSIAERQNISINYLEQVFATLRKAGLVKSIKGAQGGYILADSPSNIKVGAILRTLEGDLSVIDGEEADAGRQSTIQMCLKSALWDKMNSCLNELVDAITLEDLVHDFKKLNGLYEVMYYI